MPERKHIVFGDDESESKWIAQYSLASSDYDDEFKSTDTAEIIFSANDFDTAVRYAQQYLRKMKSEDETSEQWSDATILSVELY